MKIQVYIILFCVMFLFLSACASVETRREYFYEVQDGYVGKHIDDYWLAQPVSINHESNEIIYSYTNTEIGCEWAMIVDKRLKVIKRWNYISDADLCYEQINWRGPW